MQYRASEQVHDTVFDSLEWLMLITVAEMWVVKNESVCCLQADEMHEGSSQSHSDDRDALSTLQIRLAVSSVNITALRLGRVIELVGTLDCKVHQKIFLSAIVKVSQPYPLLANQVFVYPDAIKVIAIDVMIFK